MPARTPLHGRRLRRAAIALAVALLGTFALAGSALADSAFIAVNDTSGKSDPVVDVPRTFVVSGTTATTKRIYIKYRNPGGAPCAPTASSDSGSWFLNDSYDAPTANGNYSFSKVATQSAVGTFVYCIWIADGSGDSVAAITQTITYRAPSGTITATANPATPLADTDTTITVTGASEAPKEVYAKIRTAGGAGCAQTYYGDTGEELIYGSDVNGNFSITATTKQSTAGTYLVCLWLADSRDDTTPVAGPQPMTFTVVAPTPPAPTPVVKAPVAPSATKGCRAARTSRAAIAKKVATTKRQLLRAKRKKTRRTLTKRLKSQRKQLSTATSKMKVICGG